MKKTCDVCEKQDLERKMRRVKEPMGNFYFHEDCMRAMMKDVWARVFLAQRKKLDKNQ